MPKEHNRRFLYQAISTHLQAIITATAWLQIFLGGQMLNDGNLRMILQLQ